MATAGKRRRQWLGDGAGMNYSNSAQRLRPPKNDRPVEAETVLCVETDKRGTHLRVRKLSTVARRALRPIGLAALVALSASRLWATDPFVINSNPGANPFVPSFRDVGTDTPFDENHTTFFGWTGNLTPDPADDNGFDGPTANNIVDDPPVILGAGGADGHLVQIGTDPILASTKNIFVSLDGANSFNVHLTLTIPTNGVVGPDGFTTIIIQGIGSLTNANEQKPATPGSILGIEPEFVFGLTANTGRQEWWAKYEIPGNQSSYQVDLFFEGGPDINPGSLRVLTVDTFYSDTGYAADFAVVPEPNAATGLLGGCAMLGMIWRRRS